MPSAPPELQAKWRDDASAIAHLKHAGFKLRRDWHWTLPYPDYLPTAEDNSALDYLFLEWDFGGIVREFPAQQENG